MPSRRSKKAVRKTLSPPLARLARRIERRTARVGVLGLGYVGLPLAVEFAKEGFRVTGFDPDKRRVRGVLSARSYIEDVSSEDLAAARKGRRLSASTSFAGLATQDAIIICVPTPLRKTREPDMSYILSATQEIARRARRGQLIVLESTTYPGTTEEVVQPALEARRLKVGRDIALAFSPERIDPGNATYTTRTIPKVVGGATPACTQLAAALYGSVIHKTVPVSSAKTAEMVKILENTFRAVNIGLVNEIALICDRLGINVWEVIEGARTKPFGFMPFYPGPGIGGHCLDGREILVLKRGETVEVTSFKEAFHQLAMEQPERVHRRQGMTFIRPRGLQTLSFDLKRRKSIFRPLQWLVSRPYDGPMVHLRAGDGRELRVTNRHPMVIQNGRLGVKFAQDVLASDELVVMDSLPQGVPQHAVDLIEHFAGHPAYRERIRIMPNGWSWKRFRPWLRPVLKRYRRDPWEYYRRNAIPLAAYLEARRQPGFPAVDHREVRLTSGKGPSWTACPAVIDLTEDVCRLLGYYLSEGCITEDESLRVRFSFNRAEREYLEDVKRILNGLGFRWSTFDDRQWRTSHVKVSCVPFGILLRDALRCGIDSYSMRIPDVVFGLSVRHREAVLAGLLRGDGGVETAHGWRVAMKRGRWYRTRVNRGVVNYYTVNPRLFQQVVLLLQGSGIVPSFKRRPNLLYITGETQVRRCAGWLDGHKRRRLLGYLNGHVKRMPNRSFRRYDGYVGVPLRERRTERGRRMVYSAEVDTTHTFVTSYGIIVHNCIPSDPMYLAWKVRVHGYEARFIELATQINGGMPEVVAERVGRILNERRRALKGAVVLLLGLAYKKDVSDTRDSPAFDVVKHLAERGAVVRYHDPHVPTAELNGQVQRSVPLTPAQLRGADCVVLLTNHTHVDYDQVLRHARVIVDTRNHFGAQGRRARRVVPL